MQVDNIIWLEAIVEKLAIKHQVDKGEVEETLSNYPKFRFVERGDQVGEDEYLALGQTDAGRYLAMLFIYKTNNAELILSARDMADKERRQYARK